MDDGRTGWWQLALLVLGGGLGTSLRYLLEEAFGPAAGQVPWVTFAINVAGSFALGVVLTALAARPPGRAHRTLRLCVGTGLIGGFTTYSTFILEVDGLLGGGQVWSGLAYALGSVLAGVAAATAGVLAGQRLSSRAGAR